MSADDRHTLASASDCESKHTIVHRDAGRQERAPRRRLTAGRRWRLARSPASTAPRRWWLHFRHSSPRVPESSGNPPISTRIRCVDPPPAGSANALVISSFYRRAQPQAWVDRTQEVGGSSPPSSIATEAPRVRGFWRVGRATGNAEDRGRLRHYRERFGVDPEFVAADRIRDESNCVRRYERSFLRPFMP
jgi:hypothetical protein